MDRTCLWLPVQPDLASPIAQLQDVAMRYGTGPDVLTDLRLRLEQGSFHFLVGPSGSGKSSLLRLLALVEPVSRGRVSLFGRATADLTRAELGAAQRRIGVVFQDLRLLDHLTAFDNVALPLRLAGTTDAQIAQHVGELLAWLGLGKALAKRPPELSMGQRQLVAVGRAIVGRPRLLLADEPTSSVDEGHARRVMHLLLSLHRMGTTVVLATHSDGLIERHPFPVLRLTQGRLTPPVAAARTLPAMA
jgi:cell division transport system ATP-binding protein